MNETREPVGRRARYVMIPSALLAAALILPTGCRRSSQPSASDAGGSKMEIQNAGSDTMVNLAQAWAETYAEVNHTVAVSVAGGGSGTGIAALLNGSADIANCSRAMKDKEIAKAKQQYSTEPVQHVMGLDALAVYVHKDNPLDQITIGQLGQIYGEDGTMTKWSELGVEAPDGNDDIIRVSRQSNSGTYAYFRETVVAKGKEFKLGSRDLHGSKDVVELVGNTPSAIGYSGMGYATDHVKMLKVARTAGEEAFAPNMQNAVSGNYAVSRPLYMYTLGTPSSHVQAYIEWCLSPAGQKIVEDSGYVPNRK
ncbi:MAG: phosphate ABC transporter substrate-binding protein [Verrucomicrobia bacterium]|nr:phosphate ABC transporter substrate-binding protein [Verrucomicrobiota bacterium]MDA1087691.1 phosphate ABC transporter substrate-binding protein [Verrucomicrobiota bacterium]